MAQLGFRTIEEMVGRVDKLEINPDVLHYKSRGLDLSALLTPATTLNENHSGVTKNFEQVHSALPAGHISTYSTHFSYVYPWEG